MKSFVRIVARILFVVFIVFALMQLVVATVWADGGASATNIPNIWGMTFLDFLLWIASPAVLGAALAYLLPMLHFSDRVNAVITVIAMATVAAAIQAGTQFIPPGILQATVWQVLMLLLQMITGLAGYRAGALGHAVQMRAAGIDTKSVKLALKSANLRQ